MRDQRLLGQAARLLLRIRQDYHMYVKQREGLLQITACITQIHCAQYGRDI